MFKLSMLRKKASNGGARGSGPPSGPHASVRYRFQGRERSAVTGQTNFRMRWYNSATGRWLSRDPIGLNGECFCERGDRCVFFRLRLI